jgi:CheY-like chemotaxis protein
MGYILLAEDSAEWAKRILDLLAPLQAEIVWAPDGRQAIEHLTQNGQALDLLITDLDMPHNTGWDVIESLRGLRGDAVPIIMQTGEADYSYVRAQAGELGIVLIDKEAIRYDLFAAVSGATRGA